MDDAYNNHLSRLFHDLLLFLDGIEMGCSGKGRTEEAGEALEHKLHRRRTRGTRRRRRPGEKGAEVG